MWYASINLRGEYAETMVKMNLLDKITSYSRADMLSKPDVVMADVS